MLKFFRRIRQKLIDERNLKRYLIYAIGEIILVVIGILIAISINDWNDKRKQENKVAQLLKEVAQELSMSIEESSTLIEIYRKKDSIAYLVLNNEVTQENYLRNEIPGLSILVTTYHSINIQDNAFQSLIQNIDDLPKEYKQVVEDLKTVYVYHKDEVYHWNSKIAEVVVDFEKEAQKTKKWFSERFFFSTVDTSMANYFLNDTYYLNTVAYYYNIGLNNHLRTVINFRTAAIHSVKKIGSILKIEESFKEDFSFMNDPSDYKNWIGTYSGLNENKGNDVRIDIEEGRIFLFLNKEVKKEIFPLSDFEFHVENSPLFYSFSDNQNGIKAKRLLSRFRNNVLEYELINVY